MCVVGSGSRRWSRGSSRIRIRAMPPPSEAHYLLTGVKISGVLGHVSDGETPDDTVQFRVQRLDRLRSLSLSKPVGGSDPEDSAAAMCGTRSPRRWRFRRSPSGAPMPYPE